MKTTHFILCLIAVMILVSPASAVIKACLACNSTCNTLPGTQGLQGVNGTQGEPGLQGIQGIQGIQGYTGETGNQGEQGPAGQPGVMNQTANMTSGPAGTNGLNNMTANMTQGPAGPAGSMNLTPNMTAGPTGPTGPMNLTANMTAGPVGPTGLFNLTPNMTAGPTGPTGSMNLTANMTAGPAGAANLTANMTMNQTVLDLSWNVTYPLLSGTRVFTGKQNLGGFNLSNITTVAGSDAVTLTLAMAMNDSMRNNVSANFAPLVAGKVPTANLGGAGASGSNYLRGDQTWASPAGGSDPTAVSTTLLYSDFYSADTTGALPGLTGLAISSGTAATVATTVNHPGVIYMRDSTTALGGYKYGCVGTQLIGGGETFEVVFQPVGIRKNQSAMMGWSDTAAAATLPVDGVFFNISGNGAAISLRGNASSNSVRSGTLTAYTPTTATWYRGTIAVNAAGTLVTYTLYNEAGASLWTDTIATNIPTGAGRDTSPCIIVAEGTTDAAADIVRLDYVKWATTRTLVR